MASAEPEEGILDVFKFAAHALVDAPSLDYISSDSNEDSAERIEAPAISKSLSNDSSGESSQGSSSCDGSSYDDGSSPGVYRMEYHDFGNHTLASFGSGSDVDDDSESDYGDDYDDDEDVLDRIVQRLQEKEASTHSTLGRIADALFMPLQKEPVQSSPIVELTVSELEDEEDSTPGGENITEAAQHDLLLEHEDYSESEYEYEYDPHAGADGGDAVDTVVQQQKKETSIHGRLSQFADALFVSKTPTKEEPVKTSTKVLEATDFEAVEVTAEDSFRKMRTVTIASDFEASDETDHRGHRRHASSPVFRTATLDDEVKDAELPPQPAKSPRTLLGKPPLPTTPRSSRFQTGTPTSVSMAGAGKPPLKPDQQKRTTGSSPRGGSSHSRSSSFSFGFPSPKSADSSKPATPKKARVAGSTEFQVPSSFSADLHGVEARDQADNELRSSSYSERRTSPASVEDSTMWHWGSTTPSAHDEGTMMNQPRRMRSPRPPSGRGVPRIERVAYTEPERSIAHEKNSSPKLREEEFQLFKVARRSPREAQKHQSLPSAPSPVMEKGKPATKRRESVSNIKKSKKDTTPTANTAPTNKKEKFLNLFRSPSKHEYEVDNSELGTKEDPVEPSTVTEAAEMITNLFKMSLQAGENPTEPLESKDTKTTNTDNVKKSEKSGDASKTSSTKKKKERFSKLDREEKHRTPSASVGASKSGTKEDDAEPSSASEAVEMISSLFKMSLQTEEKPGTEEPSKSHDAQRTKSSRKNADASVSSQESGSGAVGDKKKATGHTRSLSHMSFFRSDKKEEPQAEQKKKKEGGSKPMVVEEKPADIYDLTNWLWTPFMFPTDESQVGPKDEPIVVVMDDGGEVKSKKKTKDKKGLRPWARGDKSSERSSSGDREEIKEKKKKKTKKKESKRFIANRAAKDSSRKQQAENTVIIQDDHDNFVPSTRAWSQPMPSPPPKEKKSGKSGIRKSLKSRILGRKNKAKMEEMNSSDINIVSFTHPKGKGQEMMIMTESISKKLHKQNKSHSALVKSLYASAE